jgi:hypothetical protein
MAFYSGNGFPARTGVIPGRVFFDVNAERAELQRQAV